ncbi:hypothetical protein HMPREF9141_0816 [Prevotella multiformis DSM 16608]|uniref:Uncharacterized protein n=1 Tax=Prevotella multiformis DSM 16608 TaxID=888743 RepID=F0F5F0_9BACT|nr:hypothetical protein HMPREF9141_0816 [Prevotella multiformis DSM 16608]
MVVRANIGIFFLMAKEKHRTSFVLTVRERTFIPLQSFILASDNGRLSEPDKETKMR